MKFFMVAITALMLAGCEQMTTRFAGGVMSINLPCGQKYVHASWKDSDGGLWFATRPALEGEKMVTVTYQENSRMGILTGKVKFVESPCLKK